MFTKTFDTPNGQLLFFKVDDEEDGPAIKVVGESINGTTPSAVLAYDGDEDARDTAFEKISQDLADNTALSFFQFLKGA